MIKATQIINNIQIFTLELEANILKIESFGNSRWFYQLEATSPIRMPHSREQSEQQWGGYNQYINIAFMYSI